MVLGVDRIKKLIKEVKLVESLGQRDLDNPEGAGLDLRLGEIFKIKGDTVLGIEKRKTVDSTSVAKFDPKKSVAFTIKPGEFYLVQTIERVNLPDYLVATMHPRSTLLRSGVWLLTTQIAPGYQGPLNVGLKNMGNSNFTVELGARIIHIIFWEVSGKAAAYRGQWQGGRVTTTKEETQV
ncbi:2'-deoxycytidine 5'-triphosphate deaminase [Patescibacteria group bacterium]|nr:2'-deoxycytidine 5'-triphosphate deaminase [Patescibacteria group bacterium]